MCSWLLIGIVYLTHSMLCFHLCFIHVNLTLSWPDRLLPHKFIDSRGRIITFLGERTISNHLNVKATLLVVVTVSTSACRRPMSVDVPPRPTSWSANDRSPRSTPHRIQINTRLMDDNIFTAGPFVSERNEVGTEHIEESPARRVSSSSGLLI
jgi:hypothetical protein